MEYFLLAPSALATRYPCAELRCAIAMYRFPRFITDGTLAIDPVVTVDRAVVAGSAYATYELKLLV
eukprot:11195500-Lingulodinium_polyedra.AAC.1